VVAHSGESKVMALSASGATMQIPALAALPQAMA
jgi:hypothetical protein